ncbi:MAG: hypothetical protein IKK21_11330 [Clostridia bacterium]|nr:hypothetical protein [Clostridia bacterium]
MKKTLALVMALCMLLTCVSAVAESEPTYTYNAYMAEFPTVWSPFQMQTATDGDMMDFLSDGFYGFDFNETMDGYVIEPRLAAEFPVDVTADYVGEEWGIKEGETARAWKITLRDNLAWQDGTPIKAIDFVQSAKYLLNPAAANYRADSYYSGQLVIKNAQNYVNSGRTVEKQENNLNVTRYTIADLTLGADGVYTTPQGKTVYAAVAAPLADWLSGNTLKAYVDSYGEAYFGMENWEALLAKADENGYVALTEETLGWLTSVIATEAWGETAENAPDYLAYDYVYENVEWEKVGFLATGENEIVLILDKALEGFYLHYSLTSSYLVNIPLYESLIVETDGVFTNAYGTSLETTMSYGPWMLERFQSDKEIYLVKNPYYYGYALEENAGLWQATAYQIDCIKEPSTAMEMFLNGKLDQKGLDVDQIAEYANSDYAYYQEGDSVFAMVFNPNLEALTANQAAAGENVNKTIITVKEFRMAMSMAMDRAAFCLATSPSNAPAFALYSGQIVSDAEAGEFYRTTEEAKDVVVNFWALGDEIGEGKLYATKDDAIDSLTGYNLEMAREYFNKAYDIAIAEGLMDEDDVVTIIVGTPNATSAFYNNGYDFIVNNYTEAVKGTKLEGKLVFTRDSTLGNGFSDALKNNTVDMLFGVGWTGSTFDPYGLMEAYTSSGYQYDPAWDTTAAQLTIALDGVNYTASVWDWTTSMTGTVIKAKLDDGTEVEMDKAVTTSNKIILAALENAVLQNYDFIPLMGDSNVLLKGMQIEYVTEDEVFPMSRGGVKYHTFNYSDAEWEAFVAEQGGTLNYK